MSLTQSQIEKKLTNEALDELLHLYWTEQGAEKRRDLDLMAAAISFPQDATLRVLDLCCGPGDVGRAIRARYRNSQIDCVDRDVFLISMCVGMNRREGVPGQNFVRDLWDSNWHTGLGPEYDVVAAAKPLQPRELGTILEPSKRNSWLRSHEALGLARFAVERRHVGIRLGSDSDGRRFQID